MWTVKGSVYGGKVSCDTNSMKNDAKEDDYNLAFKNHMDSAWIKKTHPDATWNLNTNAEVDDWYYAFLVRWNSDKLKARYGDVEGYRTCGELHVEKY